MRGPPFKLAPHTTLFSRVWGQLLVKRGPVSRTRAEDCTLNPIPPILVMTLSGPTRLGPGRSSQLTRSARALPPLNLMMKLSGPTKLRATHRTRFRGDYGLPRSPGGGSRLPMVGGRGGAFVLWLCPSRARTIVTVVKRQVSTCTPSCRIQQSGSADMVLRSGGVGSLAGRVLSYSHSRVAAGCPTGPEAACTP